MMLTSYFCGYMRQMEDLIQSLFRYFFYLAQQYCSGNVQEFVCLLVVMSHWWNRHFLFNHDGIVKYILSFKKPVSKKSIWPKFSWYKTIWWSSAKNWSILEFSSYHFHITGLKSNLRQSYKQFLQNSLYSFEIFLKDSPQANTLFDNNEMI